MRHPVHDYSASGAYFITICANQRHLLFDETGVREVIEATWNAIPQHFPQVSLDAFVVMPNHVHGIIVLTDPWREGNVHAQHAGHLPSAYRDSVGRATLSRVVRSFKSAVTRELRIQGVWAEQPFWQRNFYDRVVRDTEELARIREYVKNNPSMWDYDAENPRRASERNHETRWAWLEDAGR